MSTYTKKSVNAAAAFLTSDSVPGVVKFVTSIYAIGALAAVRVVAPDTVDDWCNDIEDEIETREEIELLDYFTPWSV